jgi:lipoate-protein ligase A
VPPVVELIVESGLDVRESLAQDRFLLAEAAARTRAADGVLRVYELAGDVLSLGRYHLAPRPPAAGAPRLLRRHSGGRVWAAGAGFLGVALTLPHRSALVAPDAPLALEPSQVMNRCVRGLLAALEHAGVPAVYPGRDQVTAGRRVLGGVAFEVDAAGALLFEATIGNARDAAVLPAWLDAVDPSGIVRAEMLGANDVTSVARERGRGLALGEAAEGLVAGYAARSGVRFESRALEPGERAAVARLAEDALGDARWLAPRGPRPHLRRASTTTQLGAFEAQVALDGDGTLHEVLLAGDFLADSPGVERLEQALRGCRPTVEAVEATASAVLAEPGHFVLGLGASPARVVAETVARAAAV